VEAEKKVDSKPEELKAKKSDEILEDLNNAPVKKELSENQFDYKADFMLTRAMDLLKAMKLFKEINK